MFIYISTEGNHNLTLSICRQKCSQLICKLHIICLTISDIRPFILTVIVLYIHLRDISSDLSFSFHFIDILLS